jgi:hypothetical protein
VQLPRSAWQFLGGLLEALRRPPVGQPRPTAGLIQVSGWQLDSGATVGQEHRPGAPTIQQTWEEVGGRGAPHDDVCGTGRPRPDTEGEWGQLVPDPGNGTAGQS